MKVLVVLTSMVYLVAAASICSKAKYDYGEVVTKSILFYDAQRSGKLPANNPIPWRGDSAVNDQGDHGEDLSGGWYDAGDLVKFNIAGSSAVRVLLNGIVRWYDTYTALGQINMALDSIKWELDYFLKCWIPSKQIYYYQVGDGDIDHKFWGRPEDMTMARPAFSVSPSKPGSDVAGQTAADFAAGSIAFKKTDLAYSVQLLQAAQSLYTFAVTYKGVMPPSKYYNSNDYTDELCSAGAWLFKATGNQTYLNDAKLYHKNNVPGGLDWNNGLAACQLMLYELTHDDTYKVVIQNFLKKWKPGSSTPYSPCGLAYFDKWGTCRHAANAAYAAIWAADLGIDATENRQWAFSQINYILGDNNYKMSYVIGFGSKYPVHPHHRPSSCPDLNIFCGWNFYNISTAPNPHLLIGGLVGGPNLKDEWVDDRSDYVRNEVALDYNAGLQSACAGLTHLCMTDELPPSPAPKC